MLVLLALAACVFEDARPVVHAASSTLPVVQDALGDDVVVNAGPTSVLAQQVRQGAKGALLLSLDPKWTQDLVDFGLAEKVDVVARNRLVLAAPPGAPPPTLATLETASCIAVPDPGTVPLGRYAQEALTRLGRWRALSDRTTYAADAAAATAMVASGACPVGVLYATEAQAPKVTPGEALPDAVQPEITVDLVVLDAAAEPLAARLRDPAVWARHGFLPP